MEPPLTRLKKLNYSEMVEFFKTAETAAQRWAMAKAMLAPGAAALAAGAVLTLPCFHNTRRGVAEGMASDTTFSGSAAAVNGAIALRGRA